MPLVKLDSHAQELLCSYRWPGNIRQLKNLAEQISILEKERIITYEILKGYLPHSFDTRLPAILPKDSEQANYSSEREILFKLLFDMKKDMNELKKLVHDVVSNDQYTANISSEHAHTINKIINTDANYINDILDDKQSPVEFTKPYIPNTRNENQIEDTHEIIEESLSLENNEIEFIKRALQKYHGKRKFAAQELGISERTLYRKIKEYNI